VYVTAVNQGLLKLAPGASVPTRYPFTGLGFAASGGVDAAGNAYIGNTDNGQKGHIVKLTPDGSQTELPFPGLGQDPHAYVTADGTLYVPDGNRVLKLPPARQAPPSCHSPALTTHGLSRSIRQETSTSPIVIIHAS
jgi:serine/threonine protein kinase, bacterial